MNIFKKSFQNGFTLIELLVVLGIISLFAAVIFASTSEARKNTRDKTRLVDIKQIQLAFVLNREVTGVYPDGYDSGIELGVGGAIDTALAASLTRIPKDPREPSSTYKYMYDSDFDCTAPNQKVIYIAAFETLTSEANGTATCGSDPEKFIIVLQ